MDDRERQYEELARQALDRRRMLEARRQELETRLRQRDPMPAADSLEWGQPEDPKEALSSSQLEPPWIEDHEVPVEPSRPRELVSKGPVPVDVAPRPGPRVPVRRKRLLALATRQGLRQAVLAREVLGLPKALRSPDEELP